MSLEGAIRVLAGVMILISISLAHWVSEWWLLLTGFVGLNLIQSAFTGFCPPEKIFKKLGIGTGKRNCCS
ncbi:MAG: hypothetical protein RI897_1118 [Verrucomicrobiota bacterium]